jgi:glycosyltransferase involved in cell wall biosynthesis
MRIAQLAPLIESVPPRLYGGTERVVSWLTDELVGRGHAVTLFASGDSTTRATLVPVWPRALRLGRPRVDPALALAAAFEALARQASTFDVIHCHVDWIHLPLLTRLGVPFVTTLHNRLDLPGLDRVVAAFPDAPFVAISNDQRRALADARWVETIHHGFPPPLMQPRFEPGRHLAFLGRLSPEKGPDAAIRIARAAGLPLRIAAKVPRGEGRYVDEILKPMIDGTQIRLVGEIAGRHKEAFLAGAAALIFPIDWPEPFGLVMIEAMACGTPVVAYRRGAVPEVIEDGVTGFVVDSEADAVAALARIGSLDRRRIRQEFERRFTAARMAQDYERVYRVVMGSRDGTRPQCRRS